MNVGTVKIAEDKDFQVLKTYLSSCDDEWTLQYEKPNTKVWTKSPPQEQNISFKLIKVKTVFQDVSAETLYDVLMDSQYRTTWDKYMKENYEIGHINPNNNLGYFAINCPPAKKRDFVVQSSWVATPNEYMLINHSVYHKDTPPKKGFVRAISYFTGFCITPIFSNTGGCEIGYVTHSNPKGRLPTWVTNKLSTSLAPKFIKGLHKACIEYPSWKQKHDPSIKWWLNPEQRTTPRINIELDCQPPEDGEDESSSSNEESQLDEEDVKNGSLNGEEITEDI